MTGRILVVGLQALRSREIADALRLEGWSVAEAASAEDVEGIGFTAVVARGCEPWFARLQAAGRPGARIGLSAGSRAVRAADATLSVDAPAQDICRAVRLVAPRLCSGRWQVGGAVVDLDRHRIGESEVGAQDNALLATLIAADGETVETDRLLRDAWGLAPLSNTRAVDHAAHRIRRVLEPDPSNPRYLITIRGVGLRLEGARPLPKALESGACLWPIDPDVIGLEPVAALLDAALLACERVALIGPAGSGKSVLARAWARERGWHRQDARAPPDEARFPLLIDDFEEGALLSRGPVLVTSRRAIPGFLTVYLPDRTEQLPAIADWTARHAGCPCPSRDLIDALVERIGPNALGVVRFVERSAWLGSEGVLRRLDAGQIEALGDPSSKDPRHRSLASALAPALARLPPEAVRWLSSPGTPPPLEAAALLTESGFAARVGGRLRAWPALAAWAERARQAALG